MLPCLLPDPELIVFDTITVDDTTHCITCTASVIQTTAACPLCLEAATRIHSGYQRKLADLPWAGVPVQLGLQVRRFFCQNRDCPRRIFSERIPTVAAPWARRTQRLAEAQRAIGLASGGAGGTRLCTALAMEAGIDLLLDLIRQTPLPAHPTPQVLGVDDWAMRKGFTYGTILVDLEQGHVVDILPDRTADSLEEWLRDHPGVTIISRDRASAYAEGARAGAPEAIQVADRWHLLKNLTEAVYQALQPHQTAIEQRLAQAPSADNESDSALVTVVPPLECSPVPPPSAADVARQQRAAEAHRLHAQGWTIKDIARHLGISPKTVSRYLQRTLSLAPMRRSRREGLLDPYKPYLVERWNAGCYNAAQLFREIRAQGFAGQITILRTFISELRQASGLPPRRRNLPDAAVALAPPVRPPTVRTLAHLLVRSPDQLDDQEHMYVARLNQAERPEFQSIVELAREFAAMVRQRQVDQFDPWLEKAAASPVAALRSFAAGLRQDYAAVRAALSLPWSNGPTEGHINRLKCLKRQMYGRAKLDLLRQRLLSERCGFLGQRLQGLR